MTDNKQPKTGDLSDRLSGIRSSIDEKDARIIALRSATLGVGTFEWSFDHLQELSGKVAADVIAGRAAALKG